MLRELRDRDLATDVRPDPLVSEPLVSEPLVPDPPKSRAKPIEGELSYLLGFGASLFDRYPAMRRPAELHHLDEPAFRKIRRVADADRRTGEADLALQFTAGTDSP